MGKRWLVVVVAGGLTSVGCTTHTSAPQDDTSPASTGIARLVDQAPQPATDRYDDVDPESVINAAVLLWSGGDIDRAMAEGIFTRADLDAAREGLADGSLDYLFD